MFQRHDSDGIAIYDTGGAEVYVGRLNEYVVIAKTGGTIYGNDAGALSNVVTDVHGNAVNYLGHASCGNEHDYFHPGAFRYIDTTVDGTLYFNYPASGNEFGW
jgi:hypothetical protein